MTSLIISGVIIVLLVAVIWLALRMGRRSAQKDVADDNLTIKEKQLEAALDKPDKSELIDKLRDGKF